MASLLNPHGPEYLVVAHDRRRYSVDFGSPSRIVLVREVQISGNRRVYCQRDPGWRVFLPLNRKHPAVVEPKIRAPGCSRKLVERITVIRCSTAWQQQVALTEHESDSGLSSN